MKFIENKLKTIRDYVLGIQKVFVSISYRNWIKTIIRGKGGLYSVVFIAMIVLFILYPFKFQEDIFDNLRPKCELTLLYHIMDLIPLVWISLVGLLASWINTIIYCFIEIDPREVGWNRFLAITAVCMIVFVEYICVKGYCDFNYLLLKGYNALPEIFHTFESFSEYVTKLTFISFIFFALIDFHGIKTSLIKKDKASNPDKGKYDTELKYSKLKFWLIDITVILSCSMVCLYSTHLDRSLFTRMISKGQFYSNIIMSGAWGVQIIYSQFVFYILTIRYYYEKKKYDKSE